MGVSYDILGYILYSSISNENAWDDFLGPVLATMSYYLRIITVVKDGSLMSYLYDK